MHLPIPYTIKDIDAELYRRGVKTYQIIDLLNITRPTWHNYKNGQTKIPLESANKLIESFLFSVNTND